MFGLLGGLELAVRRVEVWAAARVGLEEVGDVHLERLPQPVPRRPGDAALGGRA